MTDQSPREIAPAKAMEWARKAQDYEEDRAAEVSARHRLAADPEAGPSRDSRARHHEESARILAEARDRAITMATMWAAVAAVQPSVELSRSEP